jgi:hypothetical protein
MPFFQKMDGQPLKFNRIVSIEFMSILGSGAALGFLLGIGIASFVFVSKAASLTRALENQVARVAMLESLVSSPGVFAALDGPKEKAAPAAVTAREEPPAEAPLRVTPTAQVSVSERPRAPAPVSAVVKPPPVPVVKSAVLVSTPKVVAPAPASDVNRAPVVASSKAVAPQVADVQPAVAPHEIATALTKSKVEGVSAEKARVSKISAEGVYLISGKLIRVGEYFSSGEKLLQVDPANSRLITSERQLLLFFGN